MCICNFCIYGPCRENQNAKKSSSAVIILNTIACSCDIFYSVYQREYLNDSHLHGIVIMRISQWTVHIHVLQVWIHLSLWQKHCNILNWQKPVSACQSAYLCIGTLHLCIIWASLQPSYKPGSSDKSHEINLWGFILCFLELPVFQDYLLHSVDILKPWQAVMANTVLYITHNYFFHSYFEYDKQTSICRIQLKRGCGRKMLHPLSGGKDCWISQEVTAAWSLQTENCLKYLILPAFPDSSLCQKQSWYMTWLFKLKKKIKNFEKKLI